jgi:GGDEF domain-containing protein
LINNKSSLLVLLALIPSTLSMYIVSAVAPSALGITLTAVTTAAICGVAVVMGTRDVHQVPRASRLISAMLERQVQPGRRLAIVDPETTLLKRWYFDLRLTEEINRSHRYGSKLAVLSVRRADEPQPGSGETEVDFVQVFTRRMRSVDFATRISSGVYCVCMPHTDAAGAHAAAARLSDEIGAERVTMGMAEYDEDVKDVGSLVERALESRITLFEDPGATIHAGGEPVESPQAAEPSSVEVARSNGFYSEEPAPSTPQALNDAPEKSTAAGLLERIRSEDSGSVDVGPEETRREVRSRLRRAAKRAGVVLQLSDVEGAVHFKRSPGKENAA